MIAFLKGVLEQKTPTAAYIDVHGVGFEVGMSGASLAKLPAAGEEVAIQTYLQVRDDGMSLYGFISIEEKLLFERLIGVSGVGPKMALAALSVYAPQSLADLIAQENVGALQKIPGVGKKTASRIVLELKGSLAQGTASLFDTDEAAAPLSSALAGASEALLSMGFTSAETDLALKNAPADAMESALIQYALKRLGAQSGL